MKDRSESRYAPVFYFLARYKFLYLGIAMLMVITSALESIGVVAFFPVFSTLLEDSPERPGGILGFVTDLVSLMPLSSPILSACLLLFGIFFVKTFFALVLEALIAYGGAKVLYSVKKGVMERYAAAEYPFLLEHKQGTLIYNTLDASGSVGALLFTGSRMVAVFLKFVAITSVLLAIVPLSTLVFAGLGLTYYLVMHHFSKRVSLRLGEIKARAGTEQLVVANEFFSGFRQILTHGAVKEWTQRFDQQNRTFSDAYAKDIVSRAIPRPVMELAGVGVMLGLVAVLWIADPANIAGNLPTLGVFAVAMVQLMPPLTSFGVMRMAIMEALPHTERAYKALTGPIPRRNEGHLDIMSVEGPIVFKDVCFGYDGRDILFDKVNITFAKGKATAIVGSSGAGKTTMINLILGLFEPTQGAITVDGLPLKELNHDQWLNKIGFVSQDLFTYHATIQENIVLGRTGYSQEAIINAAKLANADGFIRELPDGYDTIVGDRGMKLSGGQQQRLAIARSVLDNPEILIFDEATSSLDSVSEKVVQDAIENASNNRTVIMISHRLSTISHANKIYVVESGKVVEEGNHQELMSKKGYYSQLAGASR